MGTEGDMYPRLGIVLERVVEDPDVVRREDAETVPVGGRAVASRAVADNAPRRLADHKAKERVSPRGDVDYATVAGTSDKRADAEAAHRSVLQPQPVVTDAEDAGVAKLIL